MRRPGLAVFAVVALAGQAPLRAEPPSVSTAAVRIGYFHGGRANLLYRTYTHGCFEGAGVKVDLYSRPTLRAREFARIPPDAWLEGRGAGKATGVEIVDRIASGEFDGGAIGEASFLDALERGRPVVAVARLGHQSAGRPGFALILRTGVKIQRPEDFKGKTLISRRAGPMDEALLREFVRQQGLDPDKDVKLLPQVDGDDATSFLLDGKADGGLYHVLKVKKLIERKAAYIYRPLDWADPEMMQALLVFNPDFLQRFPDKVQKIVDAYVARVALERALPEDKRSRSSLKGLIMAGDYQGLSIPTYDLPPRIRPESLRQAAQLLRSTGALKKIPAFEPYVDNGFVERSAARLADASAVRCSAHPRLPFQNAIVIGWDGTRRERLRGLLDQGKLPNLARLVSAGKLVDVDVTTGETDTKAGWAQILTGYDPQITGVFDNRTRYGAIPEGYTVPERLKARFGAGIATIFLSGKRANLGTRGPHRICSNCERALWDDEALFTKKSGVPPDRREILSMQAEPYHLTKDRVDIFANGLGAMDRVGARILESIDGASAKRFFLFAEFEEPDEMGHVYGEGAPEYPASLLRLDDWLGRIVQRLKDRGLYEQTLIYIVSDHGFTENSHNHAHFTHATKTFLVTNDPAVSRDTADRKDIAPTLLDRFGVDLNAVKPPLNGRSMLDGD